MKWYRQNAKNREHDRSGTELVNIRNDLKNNVVTLSANDLQRFYRLVKEFTKEIQTIQEESAVGERVEVGGHVRADVDKIRDEDPKYRGINRRKLNVTLHHCWFEGISTFYDAVMINTILFISVCPGYALEVYIFSIIIMKKSEIIVLQPA